MATNVRLFLKLNSQKNEVPLGFQFGLGEIHNKTQQNTHVQHELCVLPNLPLERCSEKPVVQMHMQLNTLTVCIGWPLTHESHENQKHCCQPAEKGTKLIHLAIEHKAQIFHCHM